MTLVHTQDRSAALSKGFELAMTRTKKLCCVDKANVLETSVYGETVQAMEKDYPEVEVSYEFVDAVAMRLVQWPNSMTS
jgi:3-isopropylmalate dehydrogenase